MKEDMEGDDAVCVELDYTMDFEGRRITHP
jgi:hypothetical protein